MSISKCRELVKTKFGLINCKGEWRISHPFGRKSKGKAVFIHEHDPKCPHKHKTEGRRR